MEGLRRRRPPVRRAQHIEGTRNAAAGRPRLRMPGREALVTLRCAPDAEPSLGQVERRVAGVKASRMSAKAAR